MEKTTFFVQGTHSDLDGLEVVCGKSQKRQNVRPVYLTQEDESQIEVRGLWIEDQFLIPINHNLTETTTPGKHVRTFSTRLDDFEITLVEYTDRLQLSVVQFAEGWEDHRADYDRVLYSEYHPLKQFGSIKLLMDDCKTNDDVEDFIEEIIAL